MADDPDHTQEELIRLRAEAGQAERAMLKAEREMEGIEHALERRLADFEHDEEVAAKHIREQLKRTDPS